MRRDQQSDPLCEIQKVHSLGHYEHPVESSVGQIDFNFTSSSSSGGSFAGMWPSKTDSQR